MSRAKDIGRASDQRKLLILIHELRRTRAVLGAETSSTRAYFWDRQSAGI
jgi:hypothetical protein